MNELISVIIPVYNTEKYLEQCLDSVAAQTYSNLEIILVDDGSTDGSGKICDLFAARDERVKVIHKENGGVSEARNAGIGISTGRYISFIDSDDFMYPDLIRKLYERITETSADLCICGRDLRDTDGNVVWVDRVDDIEGPVSAYDVLTKRLFIETGYWCVVWNKLYDRKLFDGIVFKEHGGAEDFYALCEIYRKDPKISTVKDLLYYYRTLREGSYTANTVRHRIGEIDAFLSLARVFAPESGYAVFTENVLILGMLRYRSVFWSAGTQKLIGRREFGKERRKALKNYRKAWREFRKVSKPVLNTGLCYTVFYISPALSRLLRFLSGKRNEQR